MKYNFMFVSIATILDGGYKNKALSAGATETHELIDHFVDKTIFNAK